MEKLKQLLGNSAVVTMHDRAVSILTDIGFIDFLKERARPYILGVGDDVQVLATQAARSAGYFECIEDLLYFKSRYVQPSMDSSGVIPDYGGLDESVKKGYITEGERNAIKSGSVKF